MLRRAFLKATAFFVAACTLPVRAQQETGKAASRAVLLNPEWHAVLQREPKIPAGTTITCPECGDRIATALGDIFSGQLVRSKDFQAHGSYMLAGARMRCNCGASYSRGAAYGMVGNVHTDRGWL